MMLMSPHQTAGPNHSIKIADRSTENVSKAKYLGMIVTNQNLIQEKITRGTKVSNACYHSVLNFSVFLSDV
jgi:hypothetical protein